MLAQNVKVENIKVHTLNNNYKILIKNIAKFYNIDCDFPIPTKLNEFTITKEFLHYLEEKFNLKFTNVIEEGLLLLQQKFTDDVSTVIYQKIVNIINRYLFLMDKFVIFCQFYNLSLIKNIHYLYFTIKMR